MTSAKLPFELGYSMPAEWKPHEGTWLAWPKNRESFPDDLRPEVEKAYVEMIAALSGGETVNVLVDDEESEKRVSELLAKKGMGKNVVMHRIRTEDVWFRDYGPIFVTNQESKEVAFTHWKFNAWGNKYEDLARDVHVPEKMPLSEFRSFEAPMVLEGGSIDVNGKGACLTTEQCLLNRNRNPGLKRETIESNLHDYLGATDVIWLKNGITGDDTDGHVDDLARFVSADTVVCAVEENQGDENYAALVENFSLLESAKDQDGHKLNVIPLPMPSPVVHNGQRLPASYTNFYIANGVVLVPTFKDKSDRKALNTLESVFPGREVIGINCRELVYGFGAIHCVTQQQPRSNG